MDGSSLVLSFKKEHSSVPYDNPIAAPSTLDRFPMRCRRPCGSDPSDKARSAMLDVVFLALGIGGFAVCLGYVFLCDRL
jgi:hypothetical protein